MTKRAPLSNAKKQRRHRKRRKAERERLRNQLLEAQEGIVRLKSSAGSEIEERTRLGSTPTTSARLPLGTFFFLIIRVTHPVMMTRYGWGAVRAQA